MRINAFLASAGLGSRRSVEKFILEDRVAVNGRIVRALAFRVDPTVDQIICDGKPIRAHKSRYVMFHKPRGCACTRYDPHAAKTIYDLLPSELHHLKYAGRLDVDSEGLLLLSNDGDWIQQITHPRHQMVKIYEIEVAGRPSEKILEAVRHGIQDGGEWLRVDSIRLLTQKARSSLLRVTLREGKKREIRRIFGALHHRVTRLKRISIGSLTLNQLSPGEWRELTLKEMKKLFGS